MWINRCDRNTYVGVGERRMKMKELKIKPYFRTKGRYIDGRKRIVIEYISVDGSMKTVSFKKPELILKEKGIPFIETKKRKQYKSIKIKNWGLIKAKILSRDGFRCKECETIKGLVVHHRDGNRKHNNPTNLITLCNSCHGIAHNKLNKMDGEKLKNSPYQNKK